MQGLERDTNTLRREKSRASSPSLGTLGLCQESLRGGIGIGGGTGPVPSALMTGFAGVAGWFELTTDTKLPRIASVIRQISFRIFMVTPFLS